MSNALACVRKEARITFGEGSVRDYSVLNSRLDRRASWPEVGPLLSIFWTKDVTDTNDDTALCLLLRDNDDDFRLELSAVGRYFLIMKIGQGSNRLLSDGDISSDRRLVTALALVRERRAMMDRETLESSIDFGYTEEGSMKVYNALFSEVERLPWS